MALAGYCKKHNVGGYIIADIYPEWWVFPHCPHCRMEWLEEHKDTWDCPVPYEVMYKSTQAAMRDCTVYIPMGAYEGMSDYPEGDVDVIVYRDPWWAQIKYFVGDMFWRVRFALRVLLYGDTEYWGR